MPVMFKTQQGRTLVNLELTAETMRDALGVLIEVTGFEYFDDDPNPTLFHAATWHVVEWWDAWPEVLEQMARERAGT